MANPPLYIKNLYQLFRFDIAIVTITIYAGASKVVYQDVVNVGNLILHNHSTMYNLILPSHGKSFPASNAIFSIALLT